MFFMRTTISALIEEIARIDDRAPAGKASVMENEILRAVWPLPLSRTAGSSIPADRLRRRLTSDARS
jgi:hypothetical protein